jgi:hypothetical protein
VFGVQPAEKRKNTTTRVPVPLELDDTELLFRARSASNGAKFNALWNGDYSNYTSESEATLALCDLLAFWTQGDRGRMDSLFRSSGLMRDKWDESRSDTTWGWQQIDKALDGRTEYYDPAGRATADFGVGASVYAPPEPASIGSVISAYELITEAPEVVAQLVEQFIWQGRTHWLYSGPGAGKTLLELAIIMHMAAGKPFHGLPVIQGGAIVIEEDSSPVVIADYVRMLSEIYEIELADLPLYFFRTPHVRLKDKAGVAYARSVIAAAPIKPAVFMVDACERVVPSDSFSSSELAPLSELFAENLADGISNIMIDHTRKPQAGTEKVDVIELLYGGRSKSAISDIMMYLSGAIKNRALLTYPKFRGVEPPSISITFDGSVGFTIKRGSPKLTESERLVMQVMNNSFGKGRTREEIEAEAKLPRRTTGRALQKLVDIGWLEREGDNRATIYRASAAGNGGVFS